MDATLVRASRRGSLRSVERLLAAGADADAMSVVGGKLVSAVEAACLHGHLAVVERLLAASTTAGADGRALAAASTAGCLAVVEHLLSAPRQHPDGATLQHALCAASGGGHVAVVERLLAAGADPYAGNQHVESALMCACRKGHPSVLERLLREPGAHAVSLLSQGLVRASCAGHVGVVDVLLARGADLAEDNDRALTGASFNGHADVVRRLAAAYCATHAASPESAPRTMLYACARGDVQTVAALVAVEGGMGGRQQARAAFLVACQCGHAAVVQVLLDAGYDLAGDGFLPVMGAADHGHAAVVAQLLAADASMHLQSWALWGAARAGDVALVNLVLERSENPAGLFGDADSMPHHILMEAVQSTHADGSADVVKRLLEAVADLSFEGGIALWVACERGFLAVVQCLLRAGVSANAQNDLLVDRGAAVGLDDGEVWPSGEHAVVVASRNGHLAVVEELLAFGASVDGHAPHRETALMAACEMGHVHVALRLLAAGADVHAPEDVVRRAMERMDLDLVAELMSAEVDPLTVVDPDDGDAPLRRASETGDPALVELLLRHGADARRISWDDLPHSAWPQVLKAVPRSAVAFLPDNVQPVWLRTHLLRFTPRLRHMLQRARDRLDRPPSTRLEVERPTRDELVAHLATAGRAFARDYWTDGLPVIFPGIDFGPMPDCFLFKPDWLRGQH